MNLLRREAGFLGRFGLVGLVATATHLGTAAGLLHLFPATPELLANLVAFLAALPVSLAGHRHITFRRQGRAGRFLALAFGGFLLNNGLLASLLATTPIAGLAAITLATLLVPILVYCGSRLWAFRPAA